MPERRGETGLSTGAAVEAERCWRQGGPGEGRSAVELFGGALGRPEEVMNWSNPGARLQVWE